MIKNIVGAVIGAKIAGKSPKADSPAGAATCALAASVIPFVLSRLSLPVMIAVLAGGYLLNRQKVMNNPAGDATATPKRLDGK
jgi:small ligand-binding sensory domain FIST